MQSLPLESLSSQTLRLVIIEATRDGRFGLIVCIGIESFHVVNDDLTPYSRETIEAVRQDLSQCAIGDLLLHVNMAGLPEELENLPIQEGIGQGYIHLGQEIMPSVKH